MRRFAIIFLGWILLTGCGTFGTHLLPPSIVDTPVLHGKSREALLTQRPPNHIPYNIGIYNCIDTSGQKRKGTGGGSDFSSAVPQDCAPFLMSSFRDIGFYRILERSRIDDVLKERQLATVMHGELGKKILGAMHIADAIMMGQILSYDRAVTQNAGGIALSALGGTRQYVSDSFTFSLRAISTKTGELIDDVLVKKTITSVQVDGHILRVVGVEMASLEYGATENESIGIALQETVDLAVRTLTDQGLKKGWLLQ